VEAPDRTAKASERASEVVAAFKELRKADPNPENVRHLWALAAELVANIHRGFDNYPRSLES
jgi:hypothetical protein